MGTFINNISQFFINLYDLMTDLFDTNFTILGQTVSLWTILFIVGALGLLTILIIGAFN